MRDTTITLICHNKIHIRYLKNYDELMMNEVIEVDINFNNRGKHLDT